MEKRIFLVRKNLSHKELKEFNEHGLRRFVENCDKNFPTYINKYLAKYYKTIKVGTGSKIIMRTDEDFYYDFVDQMEDIKGSEQLIESINSEGRLTLKDGGFNRRPHALGYSYHVSDIVDVIN